MNAWQTYIAIIKGNCGAAVLFVPKAYANGGYLFANFAMAFCGALVGLCSVKLVHVGQKL